MPPFYPPADPFPAVAGQPGAYWFGVDPNDPMVPPPDSGFGGWWVRVLGSLRQSWRPLLVVLLATQLPPVAVTSLVTLFYTDALSSSPLAGPDADLLSPAEADAELEALTGNLAAFIVVLLVVLVVSWLVQSLGYAAMTWVATRRAAGQPAPLGAALHFGLRRMLGLSAWTVVFTLAVAIGLCLCVLPGVYLALALSLFGPVYLFERGHVLERAWGLFHSAFGAVLGRVALIALLASAPQFVVGIGEQVAVTALGLDPGVNPVTVAGAVLGALLSLLAGLVMVVGLIVTYAERRACEAPLNSTMLASELT